MKKKMVLGLLCLLILVNIFILINPIPLKANGGHYEKIGAFSLAEPSGCACPYYGTFCWCFVLNP